MRASPILLLFSILSFATNGQELGFNAETPRVCAIAENSPLGTIACSFQLNSEDQFYQLIMPGGLFRLGPSAISKLRVDLASKTFLDREGLFSTGSCEEPSKLEGDILSNWSESLKFGCWMPARISFRDADGSVHAYQTLWIVVLDENDNMPNFHRSKFFLDVQEELSPKDEPQQMTFSLPIAQDDDAAENSTLHYALQVSV
ncbi:hypothetical protein Ciccas_010203 [Cichlidogyrus casuarinus]|uniref:Cadherin domain-containing protein n=1 Tax=Cichlidogyrus casuarinus TaxID=1844966 RepID=A0ABD2PUS2_9PLAT